MQPTAHSSFSSEPEGRRSTKGRSLWRSGGSCPDQDNAHADRVNYDHDHVFDDRSRGGDYGDEVDPVGADDQFVFLMSICVFVFINIKMILKLLV